MIILVYALFLYILFRYSGFYLSPFFWWILLWITGSLLPQLSVQEYAYNLSPYIAFFAGFVFSIIVKPSFFNSFFSSISRAFAASIPLRTVPLSYGYLRVLIFLYSSLSIGASLLSTIFSTSKDGSLNIASNFPLYYVLLVFSSAFLYSYYFFFVRASYIRRAFPSSVRPVDPTCTLENATKALYMLLAFVFLGSLFSAVLRGSIYYFFTIVWEPLFFFAIRFHFLLTPASFLRVLRLRLNVFYLFFVVFGVILLFTLFFSFSSISSDLNLLDLFVLKVSNRSAFIGEISPQFLSWYSSSDFSCTPLYHFRIFSRLLFLPYPPHQLGTVLLGYIQSLPLEGLANGPNIYLPSGLMIVIGSCGPFAFPLVILLCLMVGLFFGSSYVHALYSLFRSHHSSYSFASLISFYSFWSLPQAFNSPESFISEFLVVLIMSALLFIPIRF